MKLLRERDDQEMLDFEKWRIVRGVSMDEIVVGRAWFERCVCAGR